MSRPLPLVRVYEGEDVPVVERVYKEPTALLLVADVLAVTLRIYERDARGGFIREEDITPGEVVFDTLQTDAWWDRDATGYNFKHVFQNEDPIQTGAFKLYGGRRYRFEYRIEEVNGRLHYLVQPVEIRSTLTV